jgi:hypothetical protein
VEQQGAASCVNTIPIINQCTRTLKESPNAKDPNSPTASAKAAAKYVLISDERL